MGSRNVEKMGQGILQLIQIVQTGQCSGGYSRLFDKYAYLGGPVTEWGRKALKIHKTRLAFRIILKGLMMVIFNQINKFIFLFHSSTTPVEISKK
jgi:hypothetical protein